MMLLRHKRLVRLHFPDHAPSLEGVLVGKVNGHYRLRNAKLYETADRVQELDGETWVSRDRVLLVQVLK